MTKEQEIQDFQTISDKAHLFSIGKFQQVYHHLSENVVWTIIEENEIVGKEAVIDNCEQVSSYFKSIQTDFKTLNIISDKSKVVVNGTASFKRNGKEISFISACDVYEFNERHLIEKITSYCIEKPK